MPYTEMIIKEVMRLHPPVYVYLREPAEDVVVGGYPIKKGSLILIAPYIIHRKSKYFAEPESFRPERWGDGFDKTLPRFAYLPFSTGPRICIGNSFAMMEARLVLATMIQRFRFTPAPGHVVQPAPLITLRLKDGLPMQVRSR